MSEAVAPWRILVVDDDQVDRETVRRALRRAGLAVDISEASTSAGALESLEQQRFDCVFLDYNLPGTDGLALLNSIRRAGHDAAVIALTGHGDEQVAVELMKAGAVDYVAKADATPERLAASVRHAIELTRAHALALAAEDELRASAARSRFLAEASATLTRSLDVRGALARVAQLAVPILGDYCLIYVHANTQLELVAVAHRDARMHGAAGRLGEGLAREAGQGSGTLSGVLRDGVVAVLGPSDGAACAELDTGSMLYAPLFARTVLGAMVFGRCSQRRTFTTDEIALGEDLASRAASAVDNARLYQEANDARREAEEANRAKSEFLARMSHDLRTPLNAIGGYAQLIEEGIYGEPTEGQRESLGRIRRAQEHLLTLINDVLSFAKLEAGQVRLSVEDVPVQPALEALSTLVQPQAMAKMLSVRLENVSEELAVRADRERVTQILLNLATNAIKFTEPGGSITLSANRNADGIALRVSDTGRGIPADRIEAIFNPFVQGGRAEEERQGVGLGLAIGRELARMMGGDLTATSELGRGSTFMLTLPATEIGDGAELETPSAVG
jgi:signal transduction histidine kinase/CheY-like chemotaxis protein